MTPRLVPLVADPVAAHRVWHRPPIIDRPSPSPPPGDQRFFTAAARTRVAHEYDPASRLHDCHHFHERRLIAVEFVKTLGA